MRRVTPALVWSLGTRRLVLPRYHTWSQDLHPLRDPGNAELSPRSLDQACALSAWASQPSASWDTGHIGWVRLSGKGVLEVEGPGALQEEASCLSYFARARVPSTPRAQGAGKQHVKAVPGALNYICAPC